MPSLDEHLDDDLLIRALIYGPAKSRKTWWAGTAAEAGFNVLHVDCDNGTHILKHIAASARKRIQFIDAKDEASRPVAVQFITRLLKQNSFLWDEDNKRYIVSPTMNTSSRRALIQPKLLTSNDVLVLDSWSALQQSAVAEFNRVNSIDASEAEKPEWEGFRWVGSYLNFVLTQLKALPCHVIVVGHGTVYEKRKAGQRKGQEEIEFIRTQPRSVSNNHGMQLSEHFSDVLFTRIQGIGTQISTGGEADRDGGSRNLPPKWHKWEDLSFDVLAKASNARPKEGLAPDEHPWVKFIPAGVELAKDSESAKASGPSKGTVLKGAASKPVSLSGLAKKG